MFGFWFGRAGRFNLTSIDDFFVRVAERVADRVAERIVEEIPSAVERVAEAIIVQIGAVAEGVSRAAIAEVCALIGRMPAEFVTQFLRVVRRA